MNSALRIPLAPAQRGLYFLYRLAPGSSVYNVLIALDVHGALDLARLRRAVDLLTARHQALRTTVEEDGGAVGQVIHPSGDAPLVPLRVTQAVGADLPARRAWANREAARRAAEPFDLRHGPLWRVDVIRVAEDEHGLVFAFHHIVIDEVSAAVLGRELRAAYADPAAFDDSPPPHQYADFCREQQAEPPAERLDYWRTQLAGLDPPLLGVNASADEWLFRGDRVRFVVDPADAAALEQVCRAERVTPFMVFHAVLLVLLRRWSGQLDLAVGTPLSGRTDPRFAQTVGFFQNTVVLRTVLTDDLTLRQLLRLVRRTVVEALEHQDVPFGTVVEAVRPARSASRNPLFQVALVYNRTKVEDDWLLDGLRVDPLPFEWDTSHFDLTLSVNQHRGALHGELAFSDRRFDQLAVRQLAAAYQELLHTLLSDVAALPARLDLGLPPVPVTTAPATVESVAEGSADIERRLIALFEDVLGVPGVYREDNFFDLGGHSLLAVSLVGRVVDEIDPSLTVGVFMNNPTVARLARQLTAVDNDRSGLVRLRDSGDGATLVLLHPVGGTLFCYRDLVDALPPGPAVLGCERAPGRHRDQSTVEALADRYADAIHGLRDERLVLAGWSLGGVLAHAVAGRLTERSVQVEHLILIDAFAAREPADREPLATTAADLAALAGRVHAEGARWRPDPAADTLRRFGVDLKQFGTLAPARAAELLYGWAELLAMVARYPFPPVAVPATLLTATDNPPGYPAALARSWAGLTGPLAVVPVPGDHLTVLAPPAVSAVSEGVAAAMATGVAARAAR